MSMTESVEKVHHRVRDYYAATTEPCYLRWGRETLALHLGLAVPGETSRRKSLLRMNEFLAERAEIGTGTRVLDAGCGVGGSALWLACERSARVTGITLEPGQTALGRGFAAQRGASGVSFSCMNFEALAFRAASFDVVWNLESLCHAANPLAYLATVRRLLVPGGRFICADFFRAGESREVEAMCEGWVLPSLQPLESVAVALRELGFERVETLDLTERVLPVAEAMRTFGLQYGDLTSLREDYGETAEVQLKHYQASVAAADGLRAGSIQYACLGARNPG